MPTLAQIHPQVVHFAIALLLVGVLFRLISLSGRLKFTNHAAAVLLILGTIAVFVSVKSGDAAHGPVERIPGARPIVVEHEEAAELLENIFTGVVILEALALGFAVVPRTHRFVKITHVASALVGIWGGWTLYQTAELGGQIVYKYAGGPGLRSGEPADVERLLLAGLYNQSVADRRADRPADAARLVSEMARRFPSDTTVQFLMVESQLRDLNDPAAAQQTLAGISLAATDARFGARR
ncbi:MAG TPA: hypothetical protein PK788_10945, partial [Gemmatimonadaceae bacterium]|nr:hypothetical protein [Gemmatimonadaceae bacterium]